MPINPTDPHWLNILLNILRANAWQTGALTIAFALIFMAMKFNMVPTIDDRWMILPVAGMPIFGMLFLAAIVKPLTENILKKTQARRQLRDEQSMAHQYIPYMTDKDREIIGYLLHHNQKMFESLENGGHANLLIAKGIIRLAAKVGPIVAVDSMPCEIPDHIWSVLEKHREKFPYTPPPEGESEVPPWAMHWMS